MNAVTRFRRSFTLSEKSKFISTQQIRFEPRDPLPQGLKLEAARAGGSQLAAREQRVFMADVNGFSGGFGKQLGLAAAIHGNEPPDRFLDRLTGRQEPVISQDDGFARPERRGNARAFAGFVNNAG